MTRQKQASKVTLKKDYKKMALDAESKVIELEEKNRILGFSVKEQELAIEAMNDVIENQARKRAEHDLIVTAMEAELDEAIHKAKRLNKSQGLLIGGMVLIIIAQVISLIRQ